VRAAVLMSVGSGQLLVLLLQLLRLLMLEASLV
jgi:hypothetical protein